MPPDAWKCPDAQMSLPFGEVVTASAAAPYYSTSASNFCQRDADLQVLRDCKARGLAFRSVSSAWLGEVFDLRFRFVFHRQGESPAGPCTWYLPGMSFVGSGVLVWELKVETVPGYDDVYFTFVPNREPTVMTFFDLSTEEVQACSCEWRGWLSQYVVYPRARRAWQPQVRLFKKGDTMPIRMLAAKNGFWTLPKTSVAKFAAHWGTAVDEGSTHLDLITTAVQGVLGATPEQAVEICHQRIIGLQAETLMSTEIAQLDAAIETFEYHDREQVSQEQIRAERRVTERNELAAEYKAKLRSQREALNGKGTKRKAELKYPPLPSTIPQKTAKKFLPPGAYIWRALQRSEWAAHYKPYSRVSSKWRDHGEQGALKIVLRLVWKQYLEHQGLEQNECPVKGLFDGGELSPEGGKASSSSGNS